MNIAESLVVDNSFYTFAIAFVTGLFALLAIVAKGVFETRKTTREAKDEAKAANQSAKKAQANTLNISNGFAGTVVEKLETIERKTDDIGKAFRDHLGWHLDKEKLK